MVAQPSPADRYAADRRRRAARRTELASFQEDYPFRLDDYQLRACRALEAGRGVLVAAPTGAGKTVVGEFAAHLALVQSGKCFYTTPVKALSNQKYADLTDRYGASDVGLLTGDNSVNPDASIVVMTTEVLRNMLYAESLSMADLRFVVMDEVHYLADRSRGAVWEEVLINLPERVQVVSLSATVSNAEEFGSWLAVVRGETDLIIEERRPVPLYQHVMVGGRLHDLFVDDARTRVNPHLVALARGQVQGQRHRGKRPKQASARPRPIRRTSRVDVLYRLRHTGLLPAIVFVFSRAGCESAVQECARAGVRLTSPEEADQIRGVVERRCAHIPEADRPVLGFDGWARALEHGVASHHAGLLPTFKETVEELFAAGLVKVVFATETLALGINMPARSVVLERLVKWDGQRHAAITPGEYTQLTGRAGRRGIDVEGHAVVLFDTGTDPTALAGLASTRTYPLRSSFEPSYNMAVNVVRQVGRDAARALLESSFAQFQADRSTVGVSRRLRRNERAEAGHLEGMRCDRGDFAQYMAIRDELTTLERGGDPSAETEAIQRSARALRLGDVVHVPAGKQRGYAVVVEPASGPDGRARARPLVLTERGHTRRLAVHDLTAPIRPIVVLRIPRSFDASDADQRRDQVRTMKELLAVAGLPPRGRDMSHPAAEEIDRLRRRLRDHPCHACPERDEHARSARHLDRLRGENLSMREQMESRSATLARRLDRVVATLESLGYLDGDVVTPAGQVLASVYGELELLTAQCLADGVWDGLQPDELAALVTLVTFTPRRDEDSIPTLPRGRIRDAAAETIRTWQRLKETEEKNALDLLRVPDATFVIPCWQWARGMTLGTVLSDAEMTAGDFVRAVKQVIDVLDQISGAAPDAELRTNASRAITLVKRGVVDYSMLSG